MFIIVPKDGATALAICLWTVIKTPRFKNIFQKILKKKE